jgi:hypothetical protein
MLIKCEDWNLTGCPVSDRGAPISQAPGHIKNRLSVNIVAFKIRLQTFDKLVKGIDLPSMGMPAELDVDAVLSDMLDIFGLMRKQDRRDVFIEFGKEFFYRTLDTACKTVSVGQTDKLKGSIVDIKYADAIIKTEYSVLKEFLFQALRPVYDIMVTRHIIRR